MRDIVIAVSGKLRHGKDTVGDYLVFKYGFKQIGFADKLKEICMNYEESERALWNQQIAKELFPDENDVIIEEGIDALMRKAQPKRWQKLTHDECYDNKTNLSRHVLQVVGQGMREIRHPDVWVKYALEQCATGRWVITDMRYKNEAFIVDALPTSQIWRVQRSIQAASSEHANHISETDLDDYPFEVVLENTGTIEDLHEKIIKVMKKVEQGGQPFLTGEEVY